MEHEGLKFLLFHKSHDDEKRSASWLSNGFRPKGTQCTTSRFDEKRHFVLYCIVFIYTLTMALNASKRGFIAKEYVTW